MNYPLTLSLCSKYYVGPHYVSVMVQVMMMMMVVVMVAKEEEEKSNFKNNR